jgi:hypothetical protein
MDRVENFNIYINIPSSQNYKPCLPLHYSLSSNDYTLCILSLDNVIK